jgi:FixJ family two-component response regulator
MGILVPQPWRSQAREILDGKGHFMSGLVPSHNRGKKAAQVWVVSDDDETLTALASVLTDKQIRVSCYCELESLLRTEGAVLPACVVVDWGSGTDFSSEFVDRCRTQWPHVAILLICEGATVSFAVAAMRNGIDCVLEKPLNKDALVVEVQSAIEKSHWRSRTLQERMDARRQLENLSAVELSILEWIAHGVPNKNIAVGLSIALRTVEKYRHALFERLGVTSAAEATRIWVLGNLEE